jgi:transposase, IS5 family
VRRYSVTAAEVHDSVALPQILDDDNAGDEVWADSAYRSTLIEWFLALLHWYSQTHERGDRPPPRNC